MAAISNSSPLILYAQIGRLELLHSLFDEVFVPPAVWREVVTASHDRVGAIEVRQAGWIVHVPLPDPGLPPLLANLDPGEAEAIALASSFRPEVQILLDDRRARRVARNLGLKVVGSAGVLGLAKDVGLISAVRPVLFDLRSAGLFLSEGTVRELLRISGESSTGD